MQAQDQSTPILPVFTHSARAVDYLTTTSAANSALKDLAHEPVLGIDSEWRPNYIAGSNPNPTALVQLACPTRILLVHLAAMKRFPAQLFKLLNDEKVVKTGVGVQQDIEKLRRWSTEDAPLVPRSVLELSTLARQANPTAHPGKMSSPIALTKLVEMYLGRKLAKSRKTVMSNWEAFPLNDRQKLYGANDAYSSLSVYLELQKVLKANHRLLPSVGLDERTPNTAPLAALSSVSTEVESTSSSISDERPSKRRRENRKSIESLTVITSPTSPL